MPVAVEGTYHGRAFKGREQLARYVGLSMPMLKKLLHRQPPDRWQQKIDEYLRLQGRGPLANLIPGRDEILSFLLNYKKNGQLVALRDTPMLLDKIRGDTAELGLSDDSERLLCWIEERSPPLCGCGERRAFTSIEQGWQSDCGPRCALRKFSLSSTGKSSPRRHSAWTGAVLAGLGVTDSSLGDARAIEAIRVIVETHPRHFARLLRASPRLAEWIASRTSDLPDDAGYIERVHVAITGERPFCPRGRRRQFRRFKDGYLHCGHRSQCPCSAEASDRRMRETIVGAAPPGYITANEWCRVHRLNPPTVLADMRAGRIEHVRHGRNFFVREALTPPSKSEMVACVECGRLLMHVSGTHLRKHGLTVVEYRRRHPSAPIFGERWWRRLEEQMTRIYQEMGDADRIARFSSGAEDELAAYLENIGLVDGREYLRQYAPLKDTPLFFDFALPKEMLMVEVDGPHHWTGKWIYACTKGRTPAEMIASQKRADKTRDTLARTLGYKMFRIRVIETLDDVEPFRRQLLRQGFPRRLLRGGTPIISRPTRDGAA